MRSRARQPGLHALVPVRADRGQVRRSEAAPPWSRSGDRGRRGTDGGRRGGLLADVAALRHRVRDRDRGADDSPRHGRRVQLHTGPDLRGAIAGCAVRLALLIVAVLFWLVIPPPTG